MKRITLVLAALVAAASACLVPAHAALDGYYRAPTLHGERLVFVSEGDLWEAPLAGGVARRLTTHPAEESQPAFSPDGRSLAFVAGYEGGQDVYLMAASGGLPQRLTFDGIRLLLHGFLPSGEVLYTSLAGVGPSMGMRLRAVAPGSGAIRDIPLADANDAGWSADGQWLWFTRFGAHVNGDNVRDYRGGGMAQLWRWQTGGNAEAQRLAADYPGGLTSPMVWQDRLYLIGDEGGGNLWSMALDGSDRRKLTDHADFQVRDATLHDGRIVYALGADLRLYDIASGADRPISLKLTSDAPQRRERMIRNPLEYAVGASLAADGSRVAISARGKAVLAAPGGLRRVALEPPANGRLRNVVLAGDAAYGIVDLDGRSEVWRLAADGGPQAKALTADGAGHRWRLYPSPDGKQLAHDDKAGRLWLLDLASGTNRLLHTSSAGDDAYSGVVWSPDNRHLAVVLADNPRQISQIVLIDSRDGSDEVLTSDRYESFAPAFSTDGRWLYFLSNRHFVATSGHPWGDRNTGPLFDHRAKVYAFALQPGQRFPFQPDDELSLAAGKSAPEAEKGKDKGKGKNGKAEDKPAIPAIVRQGLRERLHEAPAAPGNYQTLAVHAERLYLFDRDAEGKGRLQVLPLSSQSPKLEVYAGDLASFGLSADGKKLVIARAPAPGSRARIGDLFIVDAGSKLPEDAAKSKVALDDWRLALDPQEEWRQMFDDAWRMHRAFSFDPAMRGQDWDAIRARFAPLLPRVGDRAELDDLLSQMVAELGILHSQVRGGDFRNDPDAAQGATLGAEIVQDGEGLRIARIYRGDEELIDQRSPLAQPGVDARDGDRLLGIDARPLRTLGELARALRQKAGQQTLLELQRGSAKAHRVVVHPVNFGRDADLRYRHWVGERAQRVEQAGQGRIGYLHLRAMGAGDMASFVRDFYAQYDREGLIIDVRRNRGGNIDSWIIEKLLRRAWAFWQPPQGQPYWNMQQTFRGHLVVLADALTYSDGETFTAGVKALGLGPVIGTRTAGAGIWLSGRNALSDNGMARIAEFGQFDAQGRWLIEVNGVAPDIEVDNLPYATARGGDAQLDAAIAHLEERLRTQPITPPRARPLPPRGTPAHDGSR
ncbi:MAG: S41 family peptidase [Lysobacteraceae bacterium]